MSTEAGPPNARDGRTTRQTGRSHRIERCWKRKTEKSQQRNRRWKKMEISNENTAMKEKPGRWAQRILKGEDSKKNL